MRSIHFISAKDRQAYGTVQMRCLQPMEILAQMGWKPQFYHFTKVDLRTTPEVAVLHRLPLNRVTDALVRYYRSRDVRLIYDTDDLIFGPDASQFKRRFERMIEQVDAVSASTTYLATLAEKFGWKTYHTPNFLGSSFLAQAERLFDPAAKRNPRHLVYASGSRTHDLDLAMIAGPLRKYLDAHADARLRILGKVEVPDDLLRSSQVEVAGFIPYADYPKALTQSGTLLIPLQRDNIFNLARSEIKYLEAGACGLKVIASPIPVFKEWEKRDPALMCCEDDQWFATLEELGAASPAELKHTRRQILDLAGPESARKRWSAMLGPEREMPGAIWNSHRLRYQLFAGSRAIRLGARALKT